MNEYTILSAIYKILGDADNELLERMLKVKKQPDEIVDIIRALRDAKKLISESDNSEDKSKPNYSNERKQSITFGHGDQWSDQSKRTWNAIKLALTDSKKTKLTNTQIIDIFRKSGLQTKARAKEGRPKILVMIENSLDRVKESRRLQILEFVYIELGISQTKGYMEAIKSRPIIE